MPTKVIHRQLHRKQIEALQSTARWCLFHGGWGGGKSQVLGLKLLMRASVKGAREILARKCNASLGKSTLKTILEGDGTNPPVFPEGTYTHHRQSQCIKIKNGGEVIYFGMDDPQKTGSINATGAALEEMVEFTQRDFDWFDSRVRLTVPGLSNQVYGACNPSVPSHWVAKMWGLALGAKPHPNTWHIRMNAADNPWLPKTYIQALERLEGVRRKRYRDGIWAGSDGLVYDNWDREIHVRDAGASGPVRCVLGVDQGFTNPFVVLRALIDTDGRAHIDAEEYQPQLLPDAKIERVRELIDTSPVAVEAVIVDPSAAELIETMRRCGMPVVPAENSLGFIDTVRGRLTPAADGNPRLTVAPSCVNFQREVESYEWAARKSGSDQLKDVPRKEDDHAMDAVRYLCAYLDSPTGVAVGGGTIIIGGSDTQGEDRFWR